MLLNSMPLNYMPLNYMPLNYMPLNYMPLNYVPPGPMHSSFTRTSRVSVMLPWVACLLSAAPTLASATAATHAATVAAEPAVPSIGRLLFGLLAVLGLLLLCAWLVRRGGLMNTSSSVIKIVSQCAVGTRERLVLVQVGEQQLLVGVTAQQISLLQQFAEPVAPLPSVPGGKFAEQLSHLMKGQRPS